MICIERFVCEGDFGNNSGAVEDIFLINNGVVAWAYLDASEDSKRSYDEVLFRMANYGFVGEYAEKECLYGVEIVGGMFYRELRRRDAINRYNSRIADKEAKRGIISYEFHVVER